ncbi:1-aminocyclopropane-1-carboxylate deaminase/D-cysteine desulfhydrase [Vicingus serpentipes]|uniref:1-aminocyclopropane-1-carboxylate deaminase/D-cysteine desulfhydrase n=1 Tax=Vicingus serpentipes TaxID=1926625 RepID=A0A5C6RU75_9FLAO|nr:1-aminocyclopropane-1-carboxylate deaminase/D-cysteine desulfhydrase [Vicingus serpentipes]
MEINENNIPLIEIFDSVLESKNSRLFILREDLIHSEISGNKWRKLKYNIQEAKNKKSNTILTFGGAYSNHIAATAAAGKKHGLNTIGVIRGEEISPLNPTLQLASDNGMIFKYVSREEYRNKNTSDFIKLLRQEYGNFYMVPEGGSNTFAVKGCTEIVNNISINFDVICCACGTGGTIAGIIASTEKQVYGFPALKGGVFLKEEINTLISDYTEKYKNVVENRNWDLITDYHLGGYAKVNSDLVSFVQEFNKKHNIPLDLIYTGKMLYGIFDLLNNSEELNNKTIIAIHTGGIQGNKGFEERLGIVL